MISNLQHLQSERTTVLRFLADIPEEDIIDRSSWLARLKGIERKIEAEQKRVVPARSAITFKGSPVFGSHGILVSFGLRATRAYATLVQQVAASLDRASPLKERGRVPNSQKFDLIMVGTALGSFGFELEERVEEQMTLDGQSLIVRSLEKTSELLQGTLGSDDELTEAITDVDPRVINQLRLFLAILAKNDATCAIETAEREFRFDSSQQVATSLVRLDTKNIVREETVLEGRFEGLLPTPRTFEFRRADTGEIVVGKIYPEVTDIAEINGHLGKPARVRALSHRVGSAKARYVLMQTPEWL